jgi:SAM-dependent methyltransferase
MAIEKDQKKFFDDYAANYRPQQPVNVFFYELAIAELRSGFRWLSGCGSVLEYGCGTGETIEIYRNTAQPPAPRIIGIDLSDVSIGVARARHPFEFHVVPDNDLTFLPAGSLDSAYMIGVLHHTREHAKIFEQIARALRPGGRFFVLDLTKTNPVIESARAVFPYMPKRVKRMFPDDLVVDDTIPEKLEVDLDGTLEAMRRAGFLVEHVDHGHLFYFVFDWLERVTRLEISRTRFNVLYRWIYGFEKKLLALRFFQRRAHLFTVHAVKE